VALLNIIACIRNFRTKCFGAENYNRELTQRRSFHKVPTGVRSRIILQNQIIFLALHTGLHAFPYSLRGFEYLSFDARE